MPLLKLKLMLASQRSRPRQRYRHGLEQSALRTKDIVAELEAQVICLTGQADCLNGKSLDLERRSKRKNLRITGLKEGAEHRQTTREFAAGLLKEVLELEEKHVIDRAHRALRNVLERMNPQGT